MKFLVLLITTSWFLSFASATVAEVWTQSDLGETATFKMENAPYPHESREEGHVYEGQSYPFDPHYVDNSVAIFIPDGYVAGGETDLLFYFHGWGNSIEKSLEKFSLRKQVVASGKNVILVFPEGPKNTKDSGLGKLEEEDGISKLSTEVIDTLYREKKIPGTNIGKVILSGHSGAYRGIAHALEVGGLDEHVSEVYLLDASYGNLDYFTNWVSRVPAGRLRSVFTEHLVPENTVMMASLSKMREPFELRLESELEDADLARQRLVFVYTREKSHSETVQLLEVFLRNAKVPDRDLFTVAYSTDSVPPGFVDIQAVIPGVEIELRYFSDDNFVGQRIDGYESARCYITSEAAEALKKVQQELNPLGLGLKIFDAYRPQRAVDHFVRWASDLGDTRMKSKYYPDVSKKDLFRDGYIAAKSGHSRGSTVDLTVVSLDAGNTEGLDMGTRWDFFGPKSWPGSQAVTAEQRAHRMLLQHLMSQHGFKPLAEEWWHFTLVDEPFPDYYFDFVIE